LHFDGHDYEATVAAPTAAAVAVACGFGRAGQCLPGRPRGARL